MKTGIYVSMSQQMMLRRQMDAIAQNVANINTPAFKAERVMFEQFLVPGANGEQVAYVHEKGVTRDLTQGKFEHTGSDFDVGINGEGYFAVDTKDGERYTRQGQFRLDAERNLVTLAGDKVQADDGKTIKLGAKDAKIEISRDGTVSSEHGRIGRLRLVKFDDEQGLVKQGEGLYGPGQQQPTNLEAKDTNVQQGFIETSNIEPVLEMTRMIDVLHSYQSSQTLMQADVDLQRRAITDITAVS